MEPRLGLDSAKCIRRAASFVLVISARNAARTQRRSRPRIGVRDYRFFRPGKLPEPAPIRAFRIVSTHLPCARYRRYRARRLTTFSRHGLRSWLSSSIRIVSRPIDGTILRRTRLGRQQAHRPARKALRRRRTNQRNYLLGLLQVQPRRAARTRRSESIFTVGVIQGLNCSSLFLQEKRHITELLRSQQL